MALKLLSSELGFIGARLYPPSKHDLVPFLKALLGSRRVFGLVIQPKGEPHALYTAPQNGVARNRTYPSRFCLLMFLNRKLRSSLVWRCVGHVSCSPVYRANPIRAGNRALESFEANSSGWSESVDDGKVKSGAIGVRCLGESMKLFLEWGSPIPLIDGSGQNLIYIVDPERLPKECGVYVFGRRRRNGGFEALYIGKANDILRLGLLPPAGRAALKWVESRLLRAFDVVTSITEPMLAAAREIGVPADRLVLLPNWANLAVVRPLDRPSRFRAELGIPADRPVVLYSGNLGRKQGVITIGDAARRSQDAGSPARVRRLGRRRRAPRRSPPAPRRTVSPTCSGCRCSPMSRSTSCSIWPTCTSSSRRPAWPIWSCPRS